MEGQIVVYSILGCPHCMKAKKTLADLDLKFKDIRLDLFPQIKDDVMKKSGMRTVPQIYFNDILIGGNDDLTKLVADKEKLNEMINKVKNEPVSVDGPIIPDPSTAATEADPFTFQCEADEYFVLVNELKRDSVIRNHGSFLSSVKNALAGKDFLDWASKQKGFDEAKAKEIGQALIDRKFIHPRSKSESKFIGGTELYVLLDHEDSVALNNGPISECVPKSANTVGEMMRKMILKLYGVYLSDDGKSVDYKGMKASEEFETYKRMTRELLRAEITNATREEKLAFFINIYNALVIHANIERGPPTSLWGRYKFFNNTKYIIGSHAYSLQDIENGVLRANRKGVGQFTKPFGSNDPRLQVALDRHEPLIHFALVCGAKSCPPIKTYSPDNIYEQLKLATASFLDNEESCNVDLKKETVHLSSIFKWYHVDFGKDNQEMLEFIVEHMGDGQKKEDLKKLMITGKYKVSYITYDWSVNSK